MQIDIVADLKTTLGEGPLWDVDQQRIYWIDSFDGRIFRATEYGGEIRAWEVGQKIGSMALRADGTHALAALQNGLHDVDLGDGTVTLIVDPESDKPGNRLNDGKVDRQGRFYFGGMDTSEKSASAGLYRYDPDGRLTCLQTGIVCSNGPCWNPDGTIFYFADTWAGEVWAYDHNPTTGEISNRRTFITVDTSSGGAADGATVDAEGCIWQALVYGGKIIRYTPAGEIDRIIDMPLKNVTSVMFGGPNLDVLYVTSMANPPLPGSPRDGQCRGALFAITGLGVKGVPEHRFAG
ncbi:SMP-30/gluconolactonase/LRE family protein [Salinicola peritrichatus]|uniref:SMP-30/gluconolactonase/LRE family protein n=1 Tax=Salinicola peritrichatus TaxID=1267424 RepID=UPI000DA21BBD|nr:SMP-30/gluconolactonase/LRE family protein [Salinicola peritrichatus]